MKNLFLVAIAAITISYSAGAMPRPTLGRPLMIADLAFVDGELPYPQARDLTLIARYGTDEPTLFRVYEDTGIRCITAPCPSFRNVTFEIVEVSTSFHNSDVVRYEAVEVLTNILPNVRMAPRRLFVTESSMELVGQGGNGFERRTIWDVEFVTFPSKSQFYTGNPRPMKSQIHSN